MKSFSITLGVIATGFVVLVHAQATYYFKKAAVLDLENLSKR